jgi:hypothetical protein
MKEHPIIFSGPMVRAILDGRKTQTRRIDKRFGFAGGVNDWTWDAEPGDVVIYRGWPHRLTLSRGANKRDAGELTPQKLTCRYGVPGDRLWVREAFAARVDVDPEKNVEKARHYARYRADDRFDPNDEQNWHQWTPWKPSIHIPRWASRILLEVTDIRVERVQDISEGDAIAEGVEKAHLDHLGQSWKTLRRGFEALWDSINAKRGYGWSQNPWVWVIGFRKLELANE